MHVSTTAFAVAAVLCCTPIADAATQEAPPQRLLEIEGVFGHTMVDVAKWARVLRVNTSDKTSYGFNVRLFVGSFGDNRIGFEIGNQRLFSYELVSQVGSTVTREKHTEAATHVGALARFTRTPKLSFDVGAGFHYFSDVSLFGLLFGANYTVLDRPRFSIPIGARLDAILDTDVTAVPMTVKSGVTIKL